MISSIEAFGIRKDNLRAIYAQNVQFVQIEQKNTEITRFSITRFVTIQMFHVHVRTWNIVIVTKRVIS